jgi:hypothetical protein
MGWHNDFVSALVSAGIQFESGVDTYPTSISLNSGVLIKLMDFECSETAEYAVSYQSKQAINGIQVIHIWEDVWLTRRKQVLSRLQAIKGLNKTIYARKTRIVSLTQIEADVFMNENHIQYSVKAKYRYGLMLNETLFAVACFSGFRKMNKSIENYKSAELVRFANLQGVTVVGGMTKLLAYFIRQHQPNDIMSYADKDWSRGSAYDRSGFNYIDQTPPATIFVNKSSLLRIFSHRIEGDYSDDSYYKIFNLGNLKYILTCE